jgi:acylphosphatase
MRITRRYVIRGRVQRVGFRYFTQKVASDEGLAGWVRNLPDGSVEATVTGDTAAVDRFERRIRQGPPGARVDDVDVDEGVAAAHDSGFQIR